MSLWTVPRSSGAAGAPWCLRLGRVAPLLVAGMAACQSTAGLHDDLEAARAAYERGRNDPLVVRNAWDDLEDARRTLAAADETWADRRDGRETRRLALLAERQADEAVAAAAQVDERAVQGQRLLGSGLPAQAAAAPVSWQAVPIQALLFEPGEARLPAASWRTVERLVEVLQQAPAQRLVLIGHADDAGRQAANRRLSQRRAAALKQALVARGIPAQRIVVRAQGARLPVASNTTASGRAMNRRVEVAFPLTAP